MQIHLSTLSKVGIAAALTTTIAVAGCSKRDDAPVPTPATVVMPGTPAPDASSAAVSDATASALPPGLAAIMGASAPATAVASSPPPNLTGGTLTVFTGTAPASSATSSDATAQRTAPPAAGASAPTAGIIGPASAPSPEPPLMGTTR